MNNQPASNLEGYLAGEMAGVPVVAGVDGGASLIAAGDGAGDRTQKNIRHAIVPSRHPINAEIIAVLRFRSLAISLLIEL